MKTTTSISSLVKPTLLPHPLLTILNRFSWKKTNIRLCSTSSLKKQHFTRRNKEHIKFNTPFPLFLGGSLDDLEITWEQWGDPSLPGERTIVICPSFSHSSHAASNIDDPRPGWWEGIIGPGLALNTNYFRIICASILGSPFGTSSPLTMNSKTGKLYKSSFPSITPRDMANCHAKLLDYLELEKVHSLVGGSLGGMQVLEFAARYPKRLDRYIAISCTAKTTPGTVAFRRIQRRAILSDPNYAGGDYVRGKGPLEGMQIARELGMTCYRSREEFDSRFDWNPISDPHIQSLTFEVESYMAYQAKKFATVYDPNCYLLLSKAMDLMDLGAGDLNVASGVGRIEAKGLIVGVQQDLLTPLSEQQSLATILQSFDREVTLKTINSKFGHDAMFNPEMQRTTFGPIIKKFVEDGIEKVLSHEQHKYSSL